MNRINQRLESVQRQIKEYENIDISKDKLLHQLYCINKHIFDLYKVESMDIPKHQKVYLITLLKDPDGNFFINNELAEKIIDKFSKPVHDFYLKLFKLKKNHKTNLVSGGTANQKGGVNINIEKTIFKDIPNFMDDTFIFLDQLLGEETEFSNKTIFPNVRVLLNWIFFPLWSLETTPKIGPIVEVPLDIIGVILDNIDVITGFLGPVITNLIDTILNAVQGIPVYGAIISGAKIAIFPILREILEFLAEHGIDLIDIFINLARKNYGLAYLSAVNAIPNFNDIIEAVINILYITNKYLSKMNTLIGASDNFTKKFKDVFDLVNSNVRSFVPVFRILITNPDIMSDPRKFIEQMIIPNKNNISILKDVSKEKLLKYLNIIEPGLEKMKGNPYLYMTDVNKIYEDIVEPFKNQIPEFKHTPKEKALNNLYLILNISTEFIDPFLKKQSTTHSN